MAERINGVRDAGMRSFFASVDHEWLLRMLAHRGADPRVLRLVRLWLRAGVIVVRYADDLVMGFEHESDARRMRAALKEQPAGFGLALHEAKTRLLMSGRFAAERRAERGLGRPETFDVLGFTHHCDRTLNDASPSGGRRSASG